MKRNQIDKNIGKSLKAIRVARGFTQEAIAQKLGISIPAYSKIESGITDVNLSRLDHLATIYDISVRELLTYKEQEEPQDLPDPEAMADILHQIAEREDEIYSLRKKVIELYDEVSLIRTSS